MAQSWIAPLEKEEHAWFLNYSTPTSWLLKLFHSSAIESPYPEEITVAIVFILEKLKAHQKPKTCLLRLIFLYLSPNDSSKPLGTNPNSRRIFLKNQCGLPSHFGMGSPLAGLLPLCESRIPRSDCWDSVHFTFYVLRGWLIRRLLIPKKLPPFQKGNGQQNEKYWARSQLIRPNWWYLFSKVWKYRLCDG